MAINEEAIQRRRDYRRGYTRGWAKRSRCENESAAYNKGYDTGKAARERPLDAKMIISNGFMLIRLVTSKGKTANERRRRGLLSRI